MWGMGYNYYGSSNGRSDQFKKHLLKLRWGLKILLLVLPYPSFKEDGSVWGMGYNPTAAVMEEMTLQATPVKIFDKGIKNIVLVDTLVYKEDGSVWGWV